MKFISLFGKTPQHRKFSFTPRFYDAQEEERRDREERIKKELSLEKEKANQPSIAEEEVDEISMQHRSLVRGSIRASRKSTTRQADPSASMLRLIILTFLALLLVAFIQFGNVALYGLLLIVPFYFFIKMRRSNR